MRFNHLSAEIVMLSLLLSDFTDIEAFSPTMTRRPSSFRVSSALAMADPSPSSKAPLDQDEGDSNKQAEIRTVNERLKEELREAAQKEKYGARSNIGKKLGLEAFRSQKTDAEREAALAEVRNLNGVNPLAALGGSFFAMGIAVGLWYLTTFLGTWFALHPVGTDVYFVQRVVAVFRNLVVGLISLASGFFGVTGLGIFLLGVRVAYGVMTGELDPTPIKNNQQMAPKMPNVWDLMMNKRPSRRNGGDDNNPFGI